MQGKTRANQVSALLSNWTIAEKSLQSALNSTGVAVNENKIYLDSIQGRLATLKATAQGFANDIIDPNWIKWVVTLGDYLVRGFDFIMTIDDKAFKGLIDLLSEQTSGLKELQDVFLLPELSDRFKMLEKYVEIFGKIPSLIGAITAALTIARKQTAILPSNIVADKKKERTYNKPLIGNVDKSVFDNFNENVFNNGNSDEYKRLLGYVSESQPTFGKAKDSLDDYLSSCIKLNEEANPENYKKFIQEKAQENYGGFFGLMRFNEDYNKLRQSEQPEVTPAVDGNTLQDDIQDVMEDSAENSGQFFEEMIARAAENGTEEQQKATVRRYKRKNRRARRAEERNVSANVFAAPDELTGQISRPVNRRSRAFEFSDVEQLIENLNIDQEQIDRAEASLPPLTLEFRGQIDDQQIQEATQDVQEAAESAANNSEDSGIVDTLIESGIEAMSETTLETSEDSNEQLDNLQEGIEQVNEQSQDTQDNMESVAEQTGDATDAQRGMLAAISGLHPEYEAWRRQNPDGNMQQYAGQLIKTKAAQFAAQAGQAAFNAAVSFGISAIITGIVSQLTSAINYYKDLAEAGKELSDQFEKSTEELDDFVEKFKEYKEQLYSGNLTEAEAYDTRSKLLDLQQQMIDTYGEEVNGINLVNGSLESQIQLMEKLGGSKSSNYLSENAQAINQAEKALDKPRWFAPKMSVNTSMENWFANDYQIEQSKLTGLTTPDAFGYQGEEVANEVNRIIKKSGLTFTGGFLSAVNMTDTETIEAWETLATELRKSKLIDTNEIESLLNQISEEINDLNDETYQNNMAIKQQASIARIMENDDYLTTYDDITTEIENYRDAIARGDQAFAAQSLQTLKNFETNISNDSEMDKWVREYFLEMFDGISQQMREAEYRDQLSQNNSEAKNNAQNIISQYFEGMDDQTIKAVQVGTEEYNALMDLVDESPVESIEELINAWVELGLVESKVVDETQQTAKSFEQQSEEISKQLSNVDAVDSAMNTLMSGGELDYSILTSLLKIYPELIDDLEMTQRGYKVSTEALQKMRNAQLKDVKLDITENISEARKEIRKLYKDNQKLNEKITDNKQTKKSLADWKNTISEVDNEIGNIRHQMQLNEFTGITGLTNEINDISAEISEAEQHIANGDYVEQYTNKLNGLKQEYSQVSDAIQETKTENKHLFDDMERRAGTTNYETMENQLEQNVKYREQVIAAQEQEGFVLDENNNLVTKQGKTYQDITKENENYNKKIDENNKQIKQQNRLIKQQQFLWRSLAADLPDYPSQVKEVVEEGKTTTDLVAQMNEEYDKYGSISISTATQFMESIPNWMDYISIDENGVISMVDGVYEEILDEATGYTEKMEKLNIAESGITAGKDIVGDKTLKTLINQYKRSGVDVEYNDQEDFLTNLDTLRTALMKSNKLDDTVATTLDQLEAEYIDALAELDSAKNAKTMLDKAKNSVIQHEDVTEFEKQVEDWNKQVQNDQLSENDFADLYNEALNNIKDNPYYDEDDQKKIEEFLTTNRSQLKDASQRTFDDAKLIIDNAREDLQMSILEYKDAYKALNETYFGPNSLLGNTEDGKKQYAENLREIEKLSSEAYDNIISRFQSSIDFGKIIDPNIINDLADVFKGQELPDAVAQVIQKGIETGIWNATDLATVAPYLTEALLAGSDVNSEAYQNAINQQKDYVISAFEDEKTQLDNQLEAGLISSGDFIDEYTKLWEKYYKDKKEFAEEDLQTQKDILEAQKNQIQEQIDALEAYSETQTEPYQAEIDALNEVKDKYSEVMDEKIDALQKQKDALDKINEEQERENDLLEKKKALEKASIKNRIVLTNNGWEARRDEEAYNEAKKEYEDAKKTEQTELLEQQIEALQNEKEAREKSIEKEITAREDAISKIEAPINNLTKVLAALIAEQHNIDPKFIADALSSKSGQDAIDILNRELGFSQRQEAQYGVDVPNDLLTVDDARDIAKDAAKNNKTTDEYAAGLGLSLGEAVTDANQKAIDELLAEYNKLVANRKAKGSDYEFEGHIGKVDYNNRPINLNEDDYNTLLGTTLSYESIANMFDEYLKGNNIESEELWNICEALWDIVETNENMHFNVSPLRPDGTAITNLNGNDDQFFGGIYDYILSQLTNGIRLEDMDIFMGGNYASGDEAARAAQEAHNDSARIYDLEADILRRLIALGYDVNKLDGVKYTGEIPVQANNNNKNSATSNTQHAADNTDLNTNTTSTDKNTEALNDLTTAITGIDNNTAEADTVTAGGFNLVADPETGKLTKKPIMVGDKQIEGQKIRAVTKSEWGKKHNKNEWSPNNKNIVPLDSLDMSFITDSKLLGFVNAARNWTSNIRQGMINIPRAADIAATSLVQPTATVGAPVFNCNITVEGNADKKTVQAFKTELHNELCEYTDQLYNSLHNSFIRQKNKK